ncbi:hypothetical protein AAC387_Pa10g1444 [Persea americana]
MAAEYNPKDGAAKQSLKLDRSLFSNSNIKPSLKPKQSFASTTTGVRRSNPASLAAAAAKDDTEGHEGLQTGPLVDATGSTSHPLPTPEATLGFAAEWLDFL